LVVLDGGGCREADPRGLVDVSWPHRDELNRTAKQLVDSGRAGSPTEAVAVLEQFVLQVAVGPSIEKSQAGQAALLTIVTAASRAFLGGVVVCLRDDPVLTQGWGSGQRLSDMVVSCGGRLVRNLRETYPTIGLGPLGAKPAGEIVVEAAWSGWSGGVVEWGGGAPREDGSVLAGVAAGAFGVSECFQHRLGSVTAGRRQVGLSLWRPDQDWRLPDGFGPKVSWLPAALWLLGLGHLGQGFAWALGMLPYSTPSDVVVYLMDTDVIVEANLSTGLLADSSSLDRRKTRVLSRALEGLGLRTAIVERRFDDNLFPAEVEPSLALAGFDSPVPRRMLGGDRFQRVVDAGLGAGPSDYLDILVHTFPSGLDPATAFPESPRGPRALPRAYQDEIDRAVGQGAEEGDVTCGMIEVHGVSVGAAFVGALAGAMGVADLLRLLQEGPEFAVVSLDLRSPAYATAVLNTCPGSHINPGFTKAR